MVQSLEIRITGTGMFLDELPRVKLGSVRVTQRGAFAYSYVGSSPILLVGCFHEYSRRRTNLR